MESISNLACDVESQLHTNTDACLKAEVTLPLQHRQDAAVRDLSVIMDSSPWRGVEGSHHSNRSVRFSGSRFCGPWLCSYRLGYQPHSFADPHTIVLMAVRLSSIVTFTFISCINLKSNLPFSVEYHWHMWYFNMGGARKIGNVDIIRWSKVWDLNVLHIPAHSGKLKWVSLKDLFSAQITCNSM